jgi:2-polyprenyl-3-methyl-5-hydroxy-6-metoxy-1,4-benzoquinol methylase
MAFQVHAVSGVAAPPSDGKLSDQGHWNEGFARISLPRTLRTTEYNCFRFDKFFRAAAPQGRKRLLEVGCGASAWLVYFAKELGYSVEGIDYSEPGCELARENLRLNQVEGNVECRDLLSLGPDAMGTFDVIFSYGVVEHFEQSGEVLRILSACLSPGGWMVVIVPNMGGIYGPLQRWWNEPVYRMHKVLAPRDLAQDLGQCGLAVTRADYFGTFFLHVVNWAHPTPCNLFRRVARRSAAYLDRLVTAGLRKLSVERESRCFSPYVLAIGVKPGAAA